MHPIFRSLSFLPRLLKNSLSEPQKTASTNAGDAYVGHGCFMFLHVILKKQQVYITIRILTNDRKYTACKDDEQMTIVVPRWSRRSLLCDLKHIMVVVSYYTRVRFLLSWSTSSSRVRRTFVVEDDNAVLFGFGGIHFIRTTTS